MNVFMSDDVLGPGCATGAGHDGAGAPGQRSPRGSSGCP